MTPLKLFRAIPWCCLGVAAAIVLKMLRGDLDGHGITWHHWVLLTVLGLGTLCALIDLCCCFNPWDKSE